MRIFVCLLLAVASCKAGFEGYGASNEISVGHEGASGYGGDIGGQDFNGGQGHTQAFAQGYNVHEPGQELGGHAGQGFGGQDLGGHGGGQSFGGIEQLQQFGGHDGGQSFGGDSYLQAAHDAGLQGHGGQEQFGGQGHFGGQQQGFALQDDGHEFDGNHGNNFGIIADQGNFGHSGYGSDQGQAFGGNGFSGHAEAIPVGEHTDVESPVEVPNYKHVTFPIPRTIHINVPKPVLVGIPQPYPVKVPVNKPVAVPVETEISIPIEKVVPYPVVKHVPYPVEKHVPIKVEKTVTVHVPQPYPVKIPVYKTIHHHKDHY